MLVFEKQPALELMRNLFWVITLILSFMLLLSSARYLFLTMNCRYWDQNNEEYNATAKFTPDGKEIAYVKAGCYSVHAVHVLSIFLCGIQITVSLAMMFVSTPTGLSTLLLNLTFFIVICVTAAQFHSADRAYSVYYGVEGKNKIGLVFIIAVYIDIFLTLGGIVFGTIDLVHSRMNRPKPKGYTRGDLSIQEKSLQTRDEVELRSYEKLAGNKKSSDRAGAEKDSNREKASSGATSDIALSKSPSVISNKKNKKPGVLSKLQKKLKKRKKSSLKKNSIASSERKRMSLLNARSPSPSTGKDGGQPPGKLSLSKGKEPPSPKKLSKAQAPEGKVKTSLSNPSGKKSSLTEPPPRRKSLATPAGKKQGESKNAPRKTYTSYLD